VLEAVDRCGVPLARELGRNVTVTDAGVDGHIRVFPTGQVLPATSTVNYRAGQTRANNAIVSLDAFGRFSIVAAQPVGTTVHVIIDLSGFFQ
jgi:hypothetical protein